MNLSPESPFESRCVGVPGSEMHYVERGRVGMGLTFRRTKYAGIIKEEPCMAVEWTEDLATGIPAVDDQHKELFRRVDALLKACMEGKGRESVGGLITFLEDYVVEHFTAEENIQIHYSYPEYRAHKAMHDRFIRDVEALKKRLETEGPSITMVATTNQVVVDWLVKHIKKVDKALGEYLKSHGYTGV